MLLLKTFSPNHPPPQNLKGYPDPDPSQRVTSYLNIKYPANVSNPSSSPPKPPETKYRRRTKKLSMCTEEIATTCCQGMLPKSVGAVRRQKKPPKIPPLGDVVAAHRGSYHFLLRRKVDAVRRRRIHKRSPLRGRCHCAPRKLPLIVAEESCRNHLP